MEEANITNNTWQTYETAPVILPDFANLLFLLTGIHGMNQGIEIGHPVYAVLFTNLVKISTSFI